MAQRGEDTYEIKDDAFVLDFFFEHKDDSDEALAKAVIANEEFWGADLKKLSGFEEEVVKDLALIREKGMYEALRLIEN